MSSVEVHPAPRIHAQPKPAPLRAFLRRPIVLSLLLAVATVVLYLPVHHHPFINFDDRDYVYENPQVESGMSWSTVKWAFTTSTAANWHPLTWLSHALDCQLFGLNPAGHHDVNVLLHALNAVLLFWVLLRATGFPGRSFMVAALFALHPINVESVAWVAERKNVLSMMFFLLALGAYRWYALRPRVSRYLIVAALYALGLMAKPQIITLPCVLFLWDYWPLQRMFAGKRDSIDDTKPAAICPARPFWWLIVEKLPLLAIAAGSAIATLHVQHGARMALPRLLRAGNAILSYGLYLRNALWPTRLALLYPHPLDSLNRAQVVASGVILLAITGLVIVGQRHRYLAVGWLWFLGTLVPMLGIIQVGVQAMADRYAYVSSLGLFIMICWAAADWSQRLHLSPSFLAILSAVVLLSLAVIARRQINYWQTDEALWAHALQVTSNNWVAESQYGGALAVGGKVPEAMPHFYRALAINPSDEDANMGVAIYLLQNGDFRNAIGYYEHVVANNDSRTYRLINAWVGMAKAYRALGDKAKVHECLEQAKKLGGH
jgi:tetratricopeptide (TPR) repeat protein